MSDIVERLRDLERVEHELAHDGDCPPEATANWKYAETCREAARTIEILRVELAKVNMENDRLTRTNRAKREHRDKLLAAKAKDAARIEQLSEELERTKREAERAQDAYGVRFLNYLEETARLTDEVERLEKLLQEIMEQCPEHVPHGLKNQIRAALEEKR